MNVSLEAFERRCAELLEFAVAQPRGGGPSWDARLEELGAPRLSPEDRERHLQQGVSLAAGALPIEFRWAVEALVQRGSGLGEERSAASAVAERTLQAYLARVKLRPSTASIFANAMATTRTYGSVQAGSGAMTCRTCGAPRMGTRERRSCEFCGSDLFSSES